MSAQGPTSPPAPAPTPTPTPTPAPTPTVAQPAASTNRWDFFRAALVLASLVFLTWWLVRHFGQDVQKATTVLGVVAPVLAAVVGVTLGYYTASQAGQAQTQTAVAQGQAQVQQASQSATQGFAAQVAPLVGSLEQRLNNILGTVQRSAESPPGKEMFVVPPREAEVPIAKVDDINEALKALSALRGMLASAGAGGQLLGH